MGKSKKKNEKGKGGGKKKGTKGGGVKKRKSKKGKKRGGKKSSGYYSCRFNQYYSCYGIGLGFKAVLDNNPDDTKAGSGVAQIAISASLHPLGQIHVWSAKGPTTNAWDNYVEHDYSTPLRKMALCFEEVRVNKVTVVINPAYNNWAMGAVNVQGQPVSIPMDMMTFHYERNEIAAFWSDSADSTRTSLDELSMTGDFGSRIFNKTAKKHVKFPTPKTMPAYNDKAVGHTPLTGIPSIKGKWVSTASFDQADYGFLDINIHHNYNAKEAGADTGSAICMYTVQVFWDVTFRKQTSLSILSRLFDYEDLCTDLYTDVIAVEEFKDKVGSLIANAAKSGDVRQVTKVDAIVGEGVLTTADKLLLQQRGKHARLSRPGAEVAHKERIHMKHVLKRFIKQADQWEFERARDKAEYKKLRDGKSNIADRESGDLSQDEEVTDSDSSDESSVTDNESVMEEDNASLVLDSDDDRDDDV